MQLQQASTAPLALASLRREEDSLRAELDSIRARLKECIVLTREPVPAPAHGAYRTEGSDFSAKLQKARKAREERAELRIAEADLMTELESVRARLEQRGIRNVALPILEHVAIASPCNASWADMVGDLDTRFCKQCEKQVHNLSMMSRAEAEAVIAVAERTGGACVRLYRRVDGTVLTDDCPIGERHRFWRRTRGIAMAGILAAVLGAMAYQMLVTQVHCASQSAAQGGSFGQ